jgi:hypothetical protein
MPADGYGMGGVCAELGLSPVRLGFCSVTPITANFEDFSYRKHPPIK